MTYQISWEKIVIIQYEFEVPHLIEVIYMTSI